MSISLQNGSENEFLSLLALKSPYFLELKFKLFSYFLEVSVQSLDTKNEGFSICNGDTNCQ